MCFYLGGFCVGGTQSLGETGDQVNISHGELMTQGQ